MKTHVELMQLADCESGKSCISTRSIEKLLEDPDDPAASYL
jgi:hypothetical protein